MSTKDADINKIITLLQQFGINEISKGFTKEICTNNGVEIGSFEKAAKAKGINIKTRTISSDYPLPENDLLYEDNRAGIETMLEHLHKLLEKMQNHPMYPLREVKDIYGYLAHFSEGSKSTEEWKKAPLDDIRERLAYLASRHVSPQVVLAQCRDIETFCKEKLLANDGARQKYDNYLELKKSGFLADIELCKKILPLEYLQSKTFVEHAAKRLKEGWTKEQKIDVYNHLVFDSADDYYEDEDLRISVVCPICRKLHYFDDIKDAQDAKCCNAPLYTKCPNCDKKIPAISEYCSICGYFIPGMQMFEVYCTQYYEAIKNSNLTEARKLMHSAEQAYPKSPKLKDMREKLNKLEKDFGEDLKQLEKDINDRLYYSAKQKLSEIRKKHPNADVSEFDKKVNAELAWVNKELEKLFSATTTEADGIVCCANIRARIGDENRVDTWLAAHPPRPVKNVNAIVNGNKKCTVTWTDTENSYVTYTIVRGENSVPKGVQDGVVIQADIRDKTVTDTNLRAGIAYYYTVFAVRAGVSVGEVCRMPAVVCDELKKENVVTEVKGAVCNFRWQLPENCQGVRVMRKDSLDENYSKLLDTSENGYADRNVDREETYYYAFKTIWKIGGKMYYSNGIELKTAIVSRPEPIKMEEEREDKNIHLSWKNSGEDHNVMIVSLKNEATPEFGKVYTSNECQSFGNVLLRTRASVGQCYQKIQEGHYYRYTIFSEYNGDMIAGSTVEISSLAPVRLNERLTQINQTGSFMLIMFDDIPETAEKIAVVIKPVNSPYVEGCRINYSGSMGDYVESTDGLTVHTFNAEECRLKKDSTRKSGGITMHNLHNVGEFDLFVFAIYHIANGEVYSGKVSMKNMNRKKCVFGYSISWKTKWGKRLRKDAQMKLLSPTEEGKKVPRAKLVCRRDGNLPLVLEPSSEIIVLAQIDETNKFDEYIKLNEDALLEAPSDAQINLILEAGEDKDYEIRSTTTQRVPTSKV